MMTICLFYLLHNSIVLLMVRLALLVNFVTKEQEAMRKDFIIHFRYYYFGYFSTVFSQM